MYWQVLRIDECYFNRWSVLFVRITKTDIMKDADNIESQVIISSLVMLYIAYSTIMIMSNKNNKNK